MVVKWVRGSQKRVEGQWDMKGRNQQNFKHTNSRLLLYKKYHSFSLTAKKGKIRDAPLSFKYIAWRDNQDKKIIRIPNETDNYLVEYNPKTTCVRNRVSKERDAKIVSERWEPLFMFLWQWKNLWISDDLRRLFAQKEFSMFVKQKGFALYIWIT